MNGYNGRGARAVLAALLLGTTGCDGGFLDEEAQDFLSPDTFYKTTADAMAAINAAYGTALDIHSSWIVVTEFPTEAVGTRQDGGLLVHWSDTYMVVPNLRHLMTPWASWYDGIASTNAVIQNVPAMAINTALRDRILAEAKFLRALTYFNLVRTYGGVPIWTEVATADGETRFPRATAAQVYDLIIKDLTEAEAVLPVSYSGPDIARASKGAARALLAKVFLQRGATGVGSRADFATSAEWSRQVIAGGRYRLLPDYASVFDNTNENNAEVIFDIQSIRAPGMDTDLTAAFSPPGWDVPARRNSLFQVEYPFLASYDPKDTRKEVSWLMRFTNRNGSTVVFDTTRATRDRYRADVPSPKKFVDMTPGPGGETENNFILLRYADVLLMRAEALNEVNNGPTAEAIDLVNQVRNRAGLANLPGGLGYAAFKDALFLERRYELVMEMQGHWDSVRHWAWAISRVEANMRASFPGMVMVPRINTAPIKEIYKLMPIPQDAIDLNPQLTQNPGY